MDIMGMANLTAKDLYIEDMQDCKASNKGVYLSTCRLREALLLSVHSRTLYSTCMRDRYSTVSDQTNGS